MMTRHDRAGVDVPWLADTGRSRHGHAGRDRRAADPARRLGAGPADAAARLLRHVRHQPVRLGDDHPADLVAPGDAQARCRSHGADDVDRARPARPVRDRGREPGHRSRPAAARALRRGRGRFRPAVRRADLGIRDDVAGAGRGGHAADRPAQAAFCPNVVEFHVPRRDVRHRDHRPGRPQPRRRAPRCLGDPLRAAGGRLARRRGAHGFGQRHRPAVQADDRRRAVGR